MRPAPGYVRRDFDGAGVRELDARFTVLFFAAFAVDLEACLTAFGAAFLAVFGAAFLAGLAVLGAALLVVFGAAFLAAAGADLAEVFFAAADAAFFAEDFGAGAAAARAGLGVRGCR